MPEILMRDLSPGQNYVFQVRAKDRDGDFSSWSTVFKVNTVSDTIAPSPVTGLSWTVVGSSFVATWTKPTTDSNGNTLKDFKDYQVTVTVGGTSKVYYVAQERFDFSFDANVGVFGLPEPAVDISVKVRDLVGNLSTAATASATNPVPNNIVNLTVSDAPDSIAVNWDAATDDDLKTYEVYLSLTDPFTPDSTNIVYSGLATNFIYSSTNSTIHYVKVRSVDVFGQGSSYASGSATPKLTSTVDTDPPGTISTVTVTTGATPVDSYIDVVWSPVADTDLQDYIIRYSTDELSWQYINVPADQTEVRISRLLPDEDYFVSVKAVDFSGNASGWTNASTYPITTAKDTTPPSKPAVPTIATGPLSIQFSHDGTKDGGGNLESDVEYFEIHASTTNGFTPSSSTLISTAPFAGPGLPIVEKIVIPMPDSVANAYWKIIAVDTAGNKSTASNQVSALPGLIENAYIQNATITDAKIQTLSAAKLIAGTAFINDLYIRSTLTIDDSDGVIQSSDYSVPLQTGWKLDENGLFIYDGVVAAKALLVQDSNNLIPLMFADFEWSQDYYHDENDLVNTDFMEASLQMRVNQTTMIGGSRFGDKALRLYDVGTAVENYLDFAVGGFGSGFNIDIEGNQTYIISMYIKNNLGILTSINVGFDHDVPGEIEDSIDIDAGTDWNRYYVIVTVPSGATKGKIYIEIPLGTEFDFYIDGLMVERQIAGIEEPSPWTPPSSTIIDGGSIVTGVIKSSAPAVSAPDQPAWSLDAEGNAQFGDVLVRGEMVVGAGGDLANSTVSSANYVANTSGWIIKGDGTVEFNDGIFRGGLFLQETIEGEDYSINIDNAISSFRFSGSPTYDDVFDDGIALTNVIDGNSPVIHMKGWSFSYDDGLFIASTPVQAVTRITPQGHLQLLHDSSHGTEIFDLDGNYTSSADPDKEINDTYGFSTVYLGANADRGIENATNNAYDNKHFLENKTRGALYNDSVGATEPRVVAKTNEISKTSVPWAYGYNPVSSIKKEVITRNYFKSNNKINDTWDIFDNAGGISYYNTNTTRNRISLISIDNNMWAAGYTNLKSLNMSFVTAGTGNPIIYLGPTDTTYNHTVTPGHYLHLSAWFATANNTIQVRARIKFSNGTIAWGPWEYLNNNFGGAVGTQPVGFPYGYCYAANFDTTAIGPVPAGVTTCLVGFEFTPVVSTSTVWMTAVHFSSYNDNNKSGGAFAAVGATENIISKAGIEIDTTADPDSYQNVFAAGSFNAPINESDWQIDKSTLTGITLYAERNNVLTNETFKVDINTMGLGWGTIPESRKQHGVYLVNNSNVSVTQSSSLKRLDVPNLVTVKHTNRKTYTSLWNENGLVWETAVSGTNYTRLWARRSGMYIITAAARISNFGTGYTATLEIWDETNNVYIARSPWVAGLWENSISMVFPASAGTAYYVGITPWNLAGTTQNIHDVRIGFAQLI